MNNEIFQNVLPIILRYFDSASPEFRVCDDYDGNSICDMFYEYGRGRFDMVNIHNALNVLKTHLPVPQYNGLGLNIEETGVLDDNYLYCFRNAGERATWLRSFLNSIQDDKHEDN